MKKIFIIFIMLAIVASMSILAKGQQEKEGPDVVTILTWENENPNYSVLGEQPIIEYVEKKLNIKIEWRLFPHAERNTATNLMIAAGGEMPDLFVSFQDDSQRALAEKGIIIPWSDLMAEGKMPLTKAKFAESRMISIKNQMTDNETGKIYALPCLDMNPLRIWTNYVRADWLDTLGLDVPQTVDEFRDMLRAFKTQDPNGNGKADEIPWQNYYEGATWIKNWKLNFGLPTPDYSLSSVDTLYWATVDKTEVVFAPTHERFKAMLIYLNSLWEEGLINQEQFNMTSPKFTATISNDTVGAQNMWPSSILGMQLQLRKIAPDGVWQGIPYPIDPRFMEPEGRVYAYLGAARLEWLIAAKGKNTDAAVRLMDYIFGDEDFIFTADFGIQGIHHEIDSNGRPYYIGKWAEMDRVPRQSALGSIVGHLPREWQNIIVRMEIGQHPKYAGHREYIKEIDKYIKPATFWKLTETQNNLARVALKKVRTYIDESISKFVIGTKSFDDWEDYVNTINKEAGKEIEAAREMYQSYFDKYVKEFY